MVEVQECRYCHVPIREADVVVGAPPGRVVTLLIDVEPHPKGRIIERQNDGALRMVGPIDEVLKPAYRVHGRTICGPDGDNAQREPIVGPYGRIIGWR